MLLVLMAGLGLLVSGANAGNQVMERDVDALMQRTAGRALPQKRISTGGALAFAVLLSAAGLACLAMVGILPAGLGLLALLLYVFGYTPLKRRSPLSLYVGAVPGALPPLIGAAAAEQHLSAAGLILFALLFAWQIPHFLAIGFLHREDYARAGFHVLAVHDASGRISGTVAVFFSAAIMVLSVAMGAMQITSWLVAAVAFVGSLMLLAYAYWFLSCRNRQRAMALFMASNIFLLVIMAAIMADRFVALNA